MRTAHYIELEASSRCILARLLVQSRVCAVRGEYYRGWLPAVCREKRKRAGVRYCCRLSYILIQYFSLREARIIVVLNRGLIPKQKLGRLRVLAPREE